MYEETIAGLRKIAQDYKGRLTPYMRLTICKAADAIEGLDRECKSLNALLGTHPDPRGEQGDPGVPTEPPKEET